MARIDDMELPEEIKEELKCIARKIPDKDILSLCKGDQNLMKGFSGRKGGASPLRSRILEHLDSKPHLRAALAEYSLNQEFVVVLSTEALKAALALFLGYFGKTPFLTALLLDEREEVRRLALEFLKLAEEEQSLPEREPALAGLREQFAPFLQHAAPCFEGAPHVLPAAPPPDGQKEDKASILSLTNENNRLRRESEKDRDYCKLRLKNAGDEKDHLSVRVEELRRERDRLKENLAKAKKSLAGTEQSFDERLASDLEKEVQERLPILRGQIERERSHVREMLLEPPARKAFHAALKAAVEAVTSPDQIILLKEKFKEFSLAGFLTGQAPEELDRICTLRLDKFMRDYAPPKKPSFEAGDSEFARALRKKTQLELLLDGHNILHLLPDFFSRDYEDGTPGRKARERLAALLKNRIVSAPALHVLLFFDGTRDSRESLLPNLSLIFAGAEPGDFGELSGDPGKNKADRAILRHITENGSRDFPRFLVTDDQALKEQAKLLGARHISVGEFGEFLFIR